MSADASPGRFGRFAILAAERGLLVDGAPVALGSRAFNLLAALVARRERVVTKEELLEVVWPGLVVEENNLQVQVSALRKVLGAQAIATVRARLPVHRRPRRRHDRTAARCRGRGRARRDPRRARPTRRSRGAPSRRRRQQGQPLLLCRSLELMGHEVASADNGRTRSSSCAAAASTCCCST